MEVRRYSRDLDGRVEVGSRHFGRLGKIPNTITAGTGISDSSGNLYGVANVGGKRVPSCAFKQGCGVAFKMTPAGHGPWIESGLYSFTGETDGRVPYSNRLFDSAGNLYGMTNYGGDNCCNPPYGCGVVFELQPQNASQER
jgi:hypothetical protein